MKNKNGLIKISLKMITVYKTKARATELNNMAKRRDLKGYFRLSKTVPTIFLLLDIAGSPIKFIPDKLHTPLQNGYFLRENK